MAHEFQFSDEQLENLHEWKKNLLTDLAKSWTAREEEAMVETDQILNSKEFRDGKNLAATDFNYLFGQMTKFAHNRNLNYLLYEKKNDIKEFNERLRTLIHGSDPLPERVDQFFQLNAIGLQTLSQFLVAADPIRYPLITAQTKDPLDLSADQDQAALDEALERFGITETSKYLDRTLEYLQDLIIFEEVKEVLGLDDFTQVNNLLWIQFEKDADDVEEEINGGYTSVGLENDLRDYLADNINLIEKGLTLIGKEYPAEEGGQIDLLCKDGKGNHVVVELKKGRAGDRVVGQTLRYIGWVKKRFNTNVRGIIIVNEPNERLSLAVAPLGGMVEIKYYRVNFEIKDSF